MDKRQFKKQHYQDRLEGTIHDVEVILNRIIKLNTTYESIDDEIIEKELEGCYFDLEISMALMSVIIRKLVENQFTTINTEDRADVNALIHSNRFDYKNEHVMVYSRTSTESIEIDHFIELGKEILKQLN